MALLNNELNIPTTERLTFCIVADWQIADEHLTCLTECLVREQPDLVLIPGDLVMTDGGNPFPWDAFFDRIQPIQSSGIPLFAVPGNHDFDGDETVAQRLWKDRTGQTELFYSFDAGPAHFTGLCITRGMLHESFHLRDGLMTQLQWLAQDLNRSKSAFWRFLFHHEPGSAFCRLNAPIDGPGSPDVSEYVEPPVWREGVDLIFRGHQHFYERTYPISPVTQSRDNPRGISLITVGGGCIAYRPERPEDATPHWFDAVIGLHQMHYLKIQLNGSVLRAEAKNLSGEIFDRFSILKRPDGTRYWEEGLPQEPVFLVENESWP